MKILLLAPQPFYQLRGTPIAVRLLAEVLGKQGHMITLLTYHEGDDVEIANVSIRRASGIPFVNKIPPGPSIKKILCDLLLLHESIRLVKADRYDLVHAVEEASFIAAVLKKRYGIPFIYDMDSSMAQQITEKFAVAGILKPFLSSLENYTIRQSLGVIAVCKYLEDIVFAVDPTKPVLRLEDISLLGDQVGEEEDLKETLRIDGKIIMYVGNLEKYQGVDLLLRSHQKVLEEIQSAHLVVVGGNKRAIEKYRRKASLLNLGSRVHFIGPRPLSRLGSYLVQADVLVSPRIRGANTPMKIYSYLDSGKPVVATSLLTHTQVLNHEIAVMVAPDPMDMAQGTLALLKDEERAKGVARRAKERVRREFSREAYERKLSGFYVEIENEAVRSQPSQMGGNR